MIRIYTQGFGESYQAEIRYFRKIAQRMLLFSRLKGDPFMDLDDDEDQLETNEAAKHEEDKN